MSSMDLELGDLPHRMGHFNTHYSTSSSSFYHSRQGMSSVIPSPEERNHKRDWHMVSDSPVDPAGVSASSFQSTRQLSSPVISLNERANQPRPATYPNIDYVVPIRPGPIQESGNEEEPRRSEKSNGRWLKKVLRRVRSNGVDTFRLSIIDILENADCEDWSVVVDVCKQISTNEIEAKNAASILRKELKHGEPSRQLNAAGLWEIFLQNTSEAFIQNEDFCLRSFVESPALTDAWRTASKQFLDSLEKVIISKKTSPTVQERLLEILTSAANLYGTKQGTEGFESLCVKLQPNFKPVKEKIDPPLQASRLEKEEGELGTQDAPPSDPTVTNLEVLMYKRPPVNLNGRISIPNTFKAAHGGFAMVYKGYLDRVPVAVKVLKYTKNPGYPAKWEASLQRRLEREIRVWSALEHPNIIKFLGYTDDFGDYAAMVSPWCEYGAAPQYFAEHVDIAIHKRIRLTCDVAEGLKYLHGLNVIHGDLKPNNILICDTGTAKLCDFGLVRLYDWQGPAGMTTTSPYTGTERYKAPEQFASTENDYPLATFEGDIYGFGCVALSFVTSKLPHHESRDVRAEVENGRAPAQRPQTSKRGSVFEGSFWDLLEKCWNWCPEYRPGILEVCGALQAISELAYQE